MGPLRFRKGELSSPLQDLSNQMGHLYKRRHFPLERSCKGIVKVTFPKSGPISKTFTPSLPRALILPRLGYPLSTYSNRESPGNPREFPKIKEKWCIMQGIISRILIMQLKQVLVFDMLLNVL